MRRRKLHWPVFVLLFLGGIPVFLIAVLFGVGLVYGLAGKGSDDVPDYWLAWGLMAIGLALLTAFIVAWRSQ